MVLVYYRRAWLSLISPKLWREKNVHVKAVIVREVRNLYGFHCTEVTPDPTQIQPYTYESPPESEC